MTEMFRLQDIGRRLFEESARLSRLGHGGHSGRPTTSTITSPAHHDINEGRDSQTIIDDNTLADKYKLIRGAGDEEAEPEICIICLTKFEVDEDVR